MTFPVWLELGPFRIHPHPLFEAIAYLVGFRIYLRDRRIRGDFLQTPMRLWVVAAAAAGAALGARLLAIAECPEELLSGEFPLHRLAGKTIVGAIVGGWLAVEAAKRLGGIESRTGDLLAIPLATSIAIGRIGCLLTGAADRTFSLASDRAWAFDFGDGVRRHPMPLYEILFLAALIVALVFARRRAPARGDLFRLFVAAYFGFRFLVDFLKPADCRPLGLSMIQWVTIVSLGALRSDIVRWSTRHDRAVPKDRSE